MSKEETTEAVAEVPFTPESTSVKEADSSVVSDAATLPQNSRTQVPLSFRIISILLVSGIGFGSSWSSGVTGAMKTTIKKVRAK
jgi:hypothetical protein